MKTKKVVGKIFDAINYSKKSVSYTHLDVYKRQDHHRWYG